MCCQEHLDLVLRLPYYLAAALITAVALIFLLHPNSPIGIWGTPRQQQDPNAPIIRAPREIVQAIASNLAPSDAACFALSSKWALDLIGSKSWKPLLRGRERESFLERLQYRKPDHLFCYRCIKFHEKVPIESMGYRACHRENGGVAAIVGFDRLPFTYAQQVMNYRLYGSRHRPLEDVASSKKVESLPDMTRTSSHSFRATKDGVTLLQDVEISFSWDNWEPRPKFPFDYRIKICPHRYHVSHRTAALMQGVDGICPICQTHVSQILEKTGPQQYRYKVSTWQPLGPCRDSREVQWQAMTADDRKHEKLLPLPLTPLLARDRYRFGI